MSKHGMTQVQQLGTLLDEFVRDRSYVPQRAQAIESLDELPLRLQARATSAPAGSQWRAWADGHRLWFIVGLRVPSKRARETTLKIFFYDHSGVLAACGIWLRPVTGNWVLYSVLNERAAECERVTGFEQLALAS